MPRGPLLLCLAAVLVLFCATPAPASLIASSQIQYCTNNGTDPVGCTRKMVVTLTVDGGQLAGVEEIVAVSSASDETSGGVTRTFSPIRLTTSRSLVRYRYPVFYVQAYNAKPYELVIPGTLLRQCNADPDPRLATCGIATNTDGTLIPYSQGFCCDCGLCSTLGLCADDARAKDACNLLNAYTQASCLRFSTHWYSGYRVGTSSTYYTINVTMTRTSVQASGGGGGGGDGAENGTVAAALVMEETATLFLSPDHVGDTNTDYGVQARLIGDFNPTEQPLVLTQSMLFVPSLPRNDPRVTAGPSEWMILDKSMVTLDGRSCDKVGVSYEAFAAQGNACRLNRGSCLNSQLEDLRAADQIKIAAGRKGQYMALSLGDFDEERYADTPAHITNGGGGNGGTNDPYISYLASSPAATMLTLTIAADDLDYVVSVATGRIVAMAMNLPVLTASTRDGEMRVEVENTGAIVSRFTVSLACGEAVFPMPAQVASLEAAQRRNVTFSVLVQRTDDVGTVECTATLRDSQEAVLDTRGEDFEVEGVEWTNGTQGGSNDPANNTTQTGKSQATCDNCGFFNIRCVFVNLCVKFMVGEILFFAGILGVLIVLLCLRRQIAWCVKLVCCGCGGGHHDDDDDDEVEAERRRKREHRRRPAYMASPSRGGNSDNTCRDPAVRPRRTSAAASPLRQGNLLDPTDGNTNNVLAAFLLLQQQQQQQQHEQLQQQLMMMGQSMRAIPWRGPTSTSLPNTSTAAAGGGSGSNPHGGVTTTVATGLYASAPFASSHSAPPPQPEATDDGKHADPRDRFAPF